MTSRNRHHAPNALTALRVFLTPAFAWCVWHAPGGGDGGTAAFLFACIAASDYYDGRLARALGAASRGGRIFDHAADIGFLLAALAVYQGLGMVPWWVPASIAASFAFYVVDSWRGERRKARRMELRASWVGHAGGVMNFVLVGVLAVDRTAGLGFLPRWSYALLFSAVPLYSAAAIFERLRRR